MSFEIKGTSVLALQAVVDGRLGRGSLARLSSAASAPWGTLPLANGRYDAYALQSVATSAAAEAGMTLLELFTASSRHNAENDLPTIHRIALRVLSPQMVLKRGAQFWRSYVAFGETRVLVNEPGQFSGVTEGIPAGLEDFVEGAWRGFVPAAVELSGGQSPRITDARWSSSASLRTLQIALTYR